MEITGDRKPQMSLYEMVGLQVNPYRNQTLEEYKANIRVKNFADLHEHAVGVGVVPIDDKDKLLERLERQYIIVNGQLEANAVQRDESAQQMRDGKKKSPLSKEQQRQVADLLSKGR